MAVWQPYTSFEYALAAGAINSHSYIKVMDWVAQLAEQQFLATGRITVIVQDHSSIHTSKIVQQHWQLWQAQGLFFFFLPKYASK